MHQPTIVLFGILIQICACYSRSVEIIRSEDFQLNEKRRFQIAGRFTLDKTDTFDTLVLQKDNVTYLTLFSNATTITTPIDGIRNDIISLGTFYNSTFNNGTFNHYIWFENERTAGNYLSCVNYKTNNIANTICTDLIVPVNLETVELSIKVNDKENKQFKSGDTLTFECKYQLLQNDTFVSLSMEKNKNLFYKYETETKTEIVQLKGLEYLRKLDSKQPNVLQFQMDNANSETADNYTCRLQFTAPKLSTKSQMPMQSIKIDYSSGAFKLAHLTEFYLILLSITLIKSVL